MTNQTTLVLLSLLPLLLTNSANAQLRTGFYKSTCPNLEALVRGAVQNKLQQTFVTAPATLRLFFHDCFVRGCDASIILASPNGQAEKDHPDNLSLAGDGFDTVIKAKAAVDSNPQCRNKVSCADILALATRDVVNLAGGPFYELELGRRDGRISTKASVQRRLPGPGFNFDQLTTMFANNGLDTTDLIALSETLLILEEDCNQQSSLDIITRRYRIIGTGLRRNKFIGSISDLLSRDMDSTRAHTIGFSHCSRFSNRVYNFSPTNRIDPSLNPQYAVQLRQMCPIKVDPRIAINMDPTTPNTFDNAYFKNLQGGKGLFTSDQVLFTDARSRNTVNQFAGSSAAFNQAFITAMTKLGRVGVLTGNQGEIRIDCTRPN